MKSFLCVGVLLISISAPVFADITWRWSFDDESGTLRTTGEVTDLKSPGKFLVTQFTVSASADESNIGAVYHGQTNAFVIWEPSVVDGFRTGTGNPFDSSIRFENESVIYSFSTSSSGAPTGQYRLISSIAAVGDQAGWVRPGSHDPACSDNLRCCSDCSAAWCVGTESRGRKLPWDGMFAVHSECNRRRAYRETHPVVREIASFIATISVADWHALADGILQRLSARGPSH